MKDYVRHATNDISIIPSCPLCKEEFLYNSFIPGKTRTIYMNYLIKYIKRNPTLVELATKKNEVQRIINKMKRDKQNFIDNMPPCIRRMTDIAFKKEYNEVMKVNREYNEANINRITNRRKCFSGICQNGFLVQNEDETYTCDTCLSNFCNRCEKILKRNHTCKQEDLDSLEEINKLPKCPNCKTPVQKIDGCDGITCAYCKTNFDYSSGQQSSYGNNQTYNAKYNKTYSLSRELDGKYSRQMVERVALFENSKPNIDYDELEPFLNIEDFSEEDKIQMFKTYSRIRTQINRAKKHNEIILAIRALHINENLTEDTLSQLI